MMIKYMIVDDESIAHDIIKKYCALLPNMQLMKDCYDGIEAMHYLKSNQVNLIFLDINMPKLTGFDFLRTLLVQPKIIVTTAYAEHALEGYELNIVDYLLKPFTFERFLKAMNKVTLNDSGSILSGYERIDTESKSNTIFLRSGNKYIQVKLDEILYIEASGNYVKVILKHEEVIIRGNLSSIMELLPTDNYIQVHRSFIVSKKHIKSIEGNQISIEKYSVPIGKYYKGEVDRLLN